MTKNKQVVSELSDDIEVVGPGAMLAQARQAMQLTQQQVADKLNFRLIIVKNIENEIFDKSLPATFNRGYLRSYAKLVQLDNEDVLASYEMLNVAKQQGAEMQSFSKATEKQAETNRIMWISYFILAMLIAATIVWWLQQGKLSTETTTALDQQEAAEEVILTYQKVVVAESPTGNDLSVEITPIESSPEASDLSQRSQPDMVETMTESTSTEQLPSAVDPEASQSNANEQSIDAVTGDGQTRVEFTFSGDCWVNIFDASGERLAWGIKKSGYVMTIKGIAPFNVTLGKPELVTIKYNDNLLDISQFNRGNIAKFSLPLEAVQL